MQRRLGMVLTVAVVAWICWGFHPPQDAPVTTGPELKVLEVRPLTQREALEKAQGFAGPNVLLRARLENKSNEEVFVLLLEGSLDPLVCMGRQQRTSEQCWTKMLGLPHQWLSLPPFGALEWEEMDASAFSGQTHVLRIMIKKRTGRRTGGTGFKSLHGSGCSSETDR